MRLNSTTLFALCTSLPFIVAIQILVPEQWKDTAIVKGKNSSNGDISPMSRATSDPDSGGVCPAMGRTWDKGPDCEPIYNGVTSIEFAEPTKDPRPIDLTMGPDLYQCTIIVGEDFNGYAGWFVGWGLTEAIDGMKIVCKKGPVPE